MNSPAQAASNGTCALNFIPQKNLNPDINMIPPFKHLVVLLFIAALVAAAGMGCNTANGFGKDMKDAGQGIQNGTK